MRHRMQRVMRVGRMARVGVALWSAMGARAATAQSASISKTPVDSGVTVFISGRTPPTVLCARLRTCVFELAPGEVLADKVLAGDTERWVFEVTTSGVNGGTQLLSIKPTDCGLSTNLVVPTDRRVYDLTLRSLPCPAEAHGKHRLQGSAQDSSHGDRGDVDVPYTRLFRFTTEDGATSAGAPAPLPVPAAAPGTPVPARALNFSYRWTVEGIVPWTPVVVFDDGVHVYIKLPLPGGAAVAPVLFAVDEDGTTSVVNYTAANGFYVTDRLAHRFVLAASANGKRDRVVIEDRRWR